MASDSRLKVTSGAEIDDGEVGAIVKSFEIALQTGAASRGLWLCLAQLQARSLEQISGDTPSGSNLQVIRNLLSTRLDGKTQISESAQAGQTIFLQCPEYAFAASEWDSLDQLVRQFPRQIIFIAYFGASTSNSLQAIVQSAARSGTDLKVGWSEIPHGRLVNFGAVFIRSSAGNVSCVLFGKNFPEQATELAQLDIAQFPDIVEVELDDLRVFPFICADLLESAAPQADETIRNTIIQRVTTSTKRAICAGGLMQVSGQASERWQRSISGLLNGLQNTPAVLAIANVATKRPDSRTGWDTWRNLTGYYVARNFRKEGQLKFQRATTYFDDPTVMGWTLRSFVPQIVIGTASFPPYEVDAGSLMPWKGFARFSCEISGNLDLYEHTPSYDELMLRASGVEDYNERKPLDNVISHLSGGGEPTAQRLASQFLNGPLAAPASDAFLPDSDPRFASALSECLAASDALLEAGAPSNAGEIPAVEWQSESNLGQLRLRCASWRALALWICPIHRQGELLSKFRRELSELTTMPEPMLLFGRAADGDFNDHVWKSVCLDNSVARGREDNKYDDLPITEAAPIELAAQLHSFQAVKALLMARGTLKFESDFSELIQRCNGMKP